MHFCKVVGIKVMTVLLWLAFISISFIRNVWNYWIF